MFKIERFDPALQDIYHLTPISQATESLAGHGYVTINQPRYEWVSENNPRVQDQYGRSLQELDQFRAGERSRFPGDPLIYRYITRTPSFVELLSLPNDKIDLMELVYRTKRIVYPAVGLAKGNEYTQWFESKENAKPDFARGIRSTATDSTVNMFLALQLVTHPQISQRYANPLDLLELAKTEGMDVDFGALGAGFVDLVGSQNVQAVLDSNIIAEENLLDFYQNVSSKHLIVAEHTQKAAKTHGKSEVDVMPPYPFFQSGRNAVLPRADYLPYIGAQLIAFMGDLPYCIPQGTQFPHRDLITLAQHYYQFAEKVLQGYLAQGLEGKLYLSYYSNLAKRAKELDPELATSAKSIGESLNNLRPLFFKLFKTYQSEPGLLNKRRTDPTDPGSLPKYIQMREEIQSFGGRAPHNTLVRRARVATKQGII